MGYLTVVSMQLGIMRSPTKIIDPAKIAMSARVRHRRFHSGAGTALRVLKALKK